MDLHRIYEKHCSWSRKTFGPIEGREISGVLEHIRRELDEVKEASERMAKEYSKPPGSLAGTVERNRARGEFVSEVADILILGMELANLMDISPTQLCATLTNKQDVNESRKWPSIEDQEPGKPIEHIDE